MPFRESTAQLFLRCWHEKQHILTLCTSKLHHLGTIGSLVMAVALCTWLCLLAGLQSQANRRSSYTRSRSESCYCALMLLRKSISHANRVQWGPIGNVVSLGNGAFIDTRVGFNQKAITEHCKRGPRGDTQRYSSNDGSCVMFEN